MIAALALLLAVQAEPPKTVNGDSLGDPKDFATRGPAVVCIRHMALQVEQGETAYLGYSGIHSGMLRLATGEKAIEYSHGEIFAKPKGQLRLADEWPGVRIYRSRHGDGVRYAVYVAGSDDGNGKGPLVWVSGSALTGNQDDRGLLRRLTFSTDTPIGCNRTYTYGWSMLFGDEPLSQKKSR